MGEHTHIFQSRVKRLNRKYEAMSRGYDARLQSDGLIVLKPRRASSRLTILPFLLLIIGFVLFKSVVLASVGSQDYSERVARLEAGSTAEQVGAFVMQADPVTQLVADKIGPVLP
ncbi:hypothetical protein [Epibacterium ulvae]|uniref:hypothetical protein n=1 Tax=Epibacterium ulvae TaxID=1156985 RepID=UPI0024905FF3|nr:hypothetical protein [Epibacterium ulvae]